MTTAKYFSMALVTACALMVPQLGYSQSGNSGSDEFPDMSKSYLKSGQFVRPDNVRRVELGTAFKSDTQEYQGMHKDQVRLELGNPHFSEGIGSNKTWNYVFNFYSGARAGNANSQEFVSCQFRVLFNDQDRAERVQWRNPQCALFTNPPVVRPLG
jgi:outer membrane protein assembly factor BamE (lipoprotein component of BamABCDE complex)